MLIKQLRILSIEVAADRKLKINQEWFTFDARAFSRAA